MCGRPSQYSGLHEFVSVLSLPNMLTSLVGEQSQRYNVAPSTQVTTLRLEEDALVAQEIRWDGGQAGPGSARSRSCCTKASRQRRSPGTRSTQQLGTSETRAPI